MVGRGGLLSHAVQPEPPWCIIVAVRSGEASMNVELVRVVTNDGVRLEGSLRLAESPETERLPVDVVIFHHGVGGNFYNQTFFEKMSDAFLALGCAVLRVNNRGHDLAFNSPAGRLG